MGVIVDLVLSVMFHLWMWVLSNVMYFPVICVTVR